MTTVLFYGCIIKSRIIPEIFGHTLLDLRENKKKIFNKMLNLLAAYGLLSEMINFAH